MYNLTHSRSKFHIGDKVESTDGSGLFSHKTATVVKHFSSPDTDSFKLRGWIPVKWDHSQELDYFPANRLFKIDGTCVYFLIDGSGDYYSSLWYRTYNEALKIAVQKNGIYIKKEFRKVCKTCPSLLAPCNDVDCYCK